MKTNKKPVLLGTLGFPGSGKTYFAKRFSKERGFFHLSSDLVRDRLFPKPTYKQAENSAVFGLMDLLAEEMIKKGVSVIYDANSTLREYRRKLRRIAEKNGGKYATLWFQTPVRIALARLAKRRKLKTKLLRKYHRPIDDWVLFSIKKETESPGRAERVLKIDGTKPYRAQSLQVLDFLKHLH